MIAAIRLLVAFFLPYCRDAETMRRLAKMVDDPDTWSGGHKLFQDIRAKTLRVQGKDPLAEAQYVFEEICAKSLYNCAYEPAPFDPDSPYHVVPNALAFARRLGRDPLEVVNIIEKA